MHQDLAPCELDLAENFHDQTFLVKAEDVSQSLSQIVKSPSGRGTIAMEVVSFVLMLPFLYKEVMLVVHYKEDWFHLSNDFHLWGEVLQVQLPFYHILLLVQSQKLLNVYLSDYPGLV